MKALFKWAKSILTPARRQGAGMAASPARGRYRPCLEMLEGRLLPCSYSISDVALPEGDGDWTAFDFTVSLNYGSWSTCGGSYYTTDGSATVADGDYERTYGEFGGYLSEGSSGPVTITVYVQGDLNAEADETFYLELFGGSHTFYVTGTILNDDGPPPPPPVPAISISDASVAEGNSGTTAAVFTATLSAASELPVSVSYATADGTSTLADGDYEAASGTLVFAPGETQKTVSVVVNGDRHGEPHETFHVNLGNPVNVTVADWQATGFIQDDEPRITISDASAVEGNTRTTAMVFTVSLSAASEQTVEVTYATADWSATLADNDYQAASGTVTFAPGETTKTIAVLVNGDRRAESGEYFFVNLANAGGGFIDDGEAVGDIIDDEPRITVGNVTRREGRKGTTQFVLTVTLSAAYDQAVTMSFRTLDGTAKAGEDYVAKTGTLTFAPSETTKTITIEVKGDSTKEGDETFNVELFGASSNALLADWWALGTILNDD